MMLYSLSLYFTAGQTFEDALIHDDPSGLPRSSLGRQINGSVSRFPFHPHPHGPSSLLRPQVHLHPS